MSRATLLILLVAAFIIASSLDAFANDSSSGESLGNKLLDDLKGSPADLPPATPVIQPRGVQGDSPAPVAKQSQPNTTQPAASALVPLSRVQQGMRHAQAVLAQPTTDSGAGNVKLANTVQHEIVSELDKLIAELAKKCQNCGGGQCDKPSQPNASDMPPKPGKGNPSSALARSQSAARDSNDRLDQTFAQPVEKDAVTDVVKQLWGHLPERSRTLMLQSFSDEFLPKYEQEIQQYYRRLSGERTDRASPPPAN